MKSKDADSGRGCYDETAVVEFRLKAPRCDPSICPSHSPGGCTVCPTRTGHPWTCAEDAVCVSPLVEREERRRSETIWMLRKTDGPRASYDKQKPDDAVNAATGDGRRGGGSGTPRGTQKSTSGAPYCCRLPVD